MAWVYDTNALKETRETVINYDLIFFNYFAETFFEILVCTNNDQPNC